MRINFDSYYDPPDDDPGYEDAEVALGEKLGELQVPLSFYHWLTNNAERLLELYKDAEKIATSEYKEAQAGDELTEVALTWTELGRLYQKKTGIPYATVTMDRVYIWATLQLDMFEIGHGGEVYLK